MTARLFNRRTLLLLACSAAPAGSLGSDSASATSCWEGQGPVSFPDADPRQDGRRLFPISLLRLALQHADCPQEVQGVRDYGQRRAELELSRGRLDVTMVGRRNLPTSMGLVVPVPIRRGLLGLRLLLCHADRVKQFEQVRDIAALKRLRLGYGVDWHDRQTLQGLGFNIMPANTYAGLFSMLEAGRSDYLSRGVNEVWPELQDLHRRRAPIVVVPQLALRYSLDDYFVVRPDAPALAAMIQHGLQEAMTDGSYQRLFDEHFGPALQRSDLSQRHWLEINDYPSDELVRLAQQHLLKPPPPAPRKPQRPGAKS